MARATADPAVASPEPVAEDMQRVVRTITANGWRQRLAPLAEHLSNRRMVRARSDCGAALALLNLDMLQVALMRLLQNKPSQGYLVVRLAVENAPAEGVAAETGIAPAQQVAAAQAALAALALEYESVGFAAVVEEPGLQGAMRTGRRD
jgi:hypothetical protein